MIDYIFFEKNSEPEIILEILNYFDSYFIPPISQRLDMNEFASKLASNATILLAKNKVKIAGFTAFYFNETPKFSYLTLLAVDLDFQGVGIGSIMVEKMISYCEQKLSAGIELEVRENNIPMLKVYKHFGFKIKDEFQSPFGNEKKYHLYLNF
jgi:ribosomal protein S18 acetylase RimI-like enzyme